jgi:alpha-mannosidase
MGNAFFIDQTQYIISSSHNDIAFLDTPLATILFRNKQVIAKAIDMLEADPQFRHSMENSLYIRDFLSLNPGLKQRLAAVMADGRFCCGASYTQFYETSVTSEGMVRQYYLGKRWLEKEFPGFKTRTAWNVDVPARAMQSAQVLKKCGIDYLFISRMDAGFFHWFSPDGSFVSGYSTGQYHANSISQIINLGYEVYNEDSRKNMDSTGEETAVAADTEGMEKIVRYLDETAESYYIPRGIPPLFAFLAIRDYDAPLNLNGYFKRMSQYDKEKQLPPFAHANPEEFMDRAVKLLDKPSFWNEYHGERPNLWIYHEISHAKAFWYSRNGLNLIDQGELLASLYALVSKSYGKYPERDIRSCWEQLLYLDHGWGGYNGHITDETYLQVSKKGYGTAAEIMDTMKGKLGDLIVVPADGAYITVFNTSHWKRRDNVVCRIDWKELGTLSFKIKDGLGREIPFQIVEEPAPYTIGIVFTPEVPACGFSRYSIEPDVNPYIKNLNTAMVKSRDRHQVVIENSFYCIEIKDGGITKLFDKELEEDLLNHDSLLKGFEVFVLDSSGNGSGEFSEIQQPSYQFGSVVDKYGVSTGYTNCSSNYGMQWRIRDHEGLNDPLGANMLIIEGEARFPHFVLIQEIKISNLIKKIETVVHIESWDGTMYREIRMALPLKERYSDISYEVPMGILRLGKDEVQGPVGTKPFIKNTSPNRPTVIYPTDCREIHPREVQSWIAAEDGCSVVMFSCPDIPTFDYHNFAFAAPGQGTLIQPILFASRHSCHNQGDPYHQRGSHHFRFSLTSAPGSLKESLKNIEGEKHALSPMISYREKQREGLPWTGSFVTVTGDVRVSCIKKAEDSDELVVRVYEPFGKEEPFSVTFRQKAKSIRKSDMLEYGGEAYAADHLEDVIKPYSIETYCITF